ncbi:MAG: restriction endonuclease subunit S [Succinivibrio sp.]|nr:restriction endonuclease subunit S [Succinivibrio sp.]
MSNLNLQKLSELCTLYSGGTPSTSNESYWNGNLNWMSSGETSNKLIYGTKLKISEKGVAESSTRLAHSGDTVVATAGEGKTRGQTSYLLTDTYVNQSIVVLEADKTKIDNKFLFYAVSNSYNRMRALSDAAGIRGSLPCKLLNNFEINTFNLDIENKIGQFLFNIDLKIENNNKINTELESLAKTIYDYWFLQFEFPNEEGKPYKSSGGKMVWNEELKRKIPEGWASENFGKLFSSQAGFAFKSTDWVEKGFPVLTIKSIQNNCQVDMSQASFISNFEDKHLKYKVRNGNIIFAMSGNTIGKIGVIASKESNIFINQRVLIIKTTSEDLAYIYFLFNDKAMQNNIRQKGANSAQPNISEESLRAIKVCIPQEAILNKYNKLCKKFFDVIIQNNIENSELSSLRDFLLPMLMNGQVQFK